MMTTARVYLAIFRIALSQSMEYRMNFFISSSLGLVIGAAIHIFLWSAVYDAIDQPQIAAFDRRAMMFYIGCATLCSVLTRAYRKEREIAAEIRSGELNKYLIKPFPFLGFLASFSLGERLSGWLFLLAIAFGIGLPLLQAANLSVSWTGVLWALPYLCCGMVLNFLFTLGIAFLAFWFDEVWTFQVMKDLILWFLSGQVFPMEVLPPGWQFVAALLPFQYIAYVPAALMTGRWGGAEALVHLPIVLLHIGVIALAVHAIWRKGLQRYGAFGG